jgi:hypothetical protein
LYFFGIEFQELPKDGMRNLCLTLVLGEARTGAHQCASTTLNESLMDDLSILGGAFNKIKLCNKEISNIKGKG